MQSLSGDSLFMHTLDDSPAKATDTAQCSAAFTRSTYDMTNMDVEMQLSTESWITVIVLDTNILLEFLDIIQTFVLEVEWQQLPVFIVIPGVVIHELDIQKNREGLSWFARRASTWLLKKVRERKSVKSQALDETCKSSRNWKVKEQGEELGAERANDGLILDCCQYFHRVRQCRTFLCSKDKLLAVEAESVGVRTIFPDQRKFCSRELANVVFGDEAPMLRFSEHFRSYHGDRTTQDTGRNEDGMDVDDDSAATKVVRPSHPLDLLHLQVIEHFGELLLELVANVAGPEAEKFGADAASIHAPAYARKQLMFWTITDSLEFLNTKKNWRHSSPRLDEFLKRPYGMGARRGQDWSRRDWDVALGTLGTLGDVWADREPGACIGESVRAVEAQLCLYY